MTKLTRIRHKIRWYLDPRYRKRLQAINKILKYGYGPTLIDDLYRENATMKYMRENQKGD